MNHVSDLSIDSIVAKVSDYGSIEDFKADTLYHATGEIIEGVLRGGGYDDVLWTARMPDVAQTYIPDAGISTYYKEPDSWTMSETIRIYRPDCLEVELAKQMGYEFKINTDQHDRVTSYIATKDGVRATPTYSEIWAFLCDDLGYKKDYDGSINIKSTFIDKKHTYLHSDYKHPGSLYIISGASQLKLYNISTGEGNLMDPHYHKLDLFERLKIEGYDGVIIDDFCQTKTFGNLGHESIGLFPSGIAKLECRSIFATHHEWNSDATFKDFGKSKEFDPVVIFDRSREEMLFLKNAEEKECHPRQHP